MIQNVKAFVEYYCTIDKPVPYKDLFIYPIKVKEYQDFLSAYGILKLEKNTIPDIEIIQMSYLDYLLSVEINNDTEIKGHTGMTIGAFQLQRLISLLKLCFHVEPQDLKAQKDEKGHYSLIIKDTEINSKEFEEISRIISYQNILNYFDGYIDPDFKKSVDEYYALKNKNLSLPSLENKIVIVIMLTGILKKDILEMSYRDFENIFQYALDKENYNIMRTGEFAGVKFDKPVSHWVYSTKKNKYEEAFTSYDGFKDKITKVN